MANVGEVVTILAKSIPFRTEFNLAMKESRETPTTWLARVKALSELCDFGQGQNLRILDKFLTGFDTEVINHLCSAAEHLDIETALEITEAYRRRKTGNGTEAIVMLDKIEQEDKGACKFVDQTKPAISEFLMVKCEDIADENEELQGENDFFNEFNDHTFDDGAAGDNNSSSSSSDSGNDNIGKDRDFNISDYESNFKKNAKRVKRKYVKKADKEKLAQAVKAETADAPADPNLPKKKRNYKQRARKEKEIFECDICHYKVNHKCHLIRHMMIHMNNKSFLCNVCGKGFNLFLNLNAHLRRHSGYKPHVCEVCKASFIDKTRLKLHTRTHTGERPYGCTMCDKRFADRYYMKIHMRLHTGEKPFKCDQCLRTFSQSSSLSLHKRKSCLFNKNF